MSGGHEYPGLQVCQILGVPMAMHKRDSPTTCIIFLGIIMDTIAGEMRLPTEKLERLGSLLQSWGDKRACSRTELESLIGHLNHACKVIRPGRSFLHRMLDLLHSTHRSTKFICLNTGFHADLAWLSVNGTEFPSCHPQPTSLKLR